MIEEEQSSSGPVPSKVGLLMALATFSVWGYTLLGRIHSEIRSMALLNKLSLSGNPLKDSILTTLDVLSNLFWLNLELITVGGSIPLGFGLV